MPEIFSYDYALQSDYEDELRSFRDAFYLPDPNLIYLDGNSLGVLPNSTPQLLDHVVKHEWGNRLIRSWNEGWYERPSETGASLANLLGAHPEEVIMADSTSVNLFKLAFAALKYQHGRTSIVSDALNFPSDLYVLQGLVEHFGRQYQLRLVPSPDGIGIEMDKLAELLDKQTALLSLSHIVFKSSFMYDMKEVSRLAHDKGALVIWDLSHAAGAVPVRLNESGADMAIGCTYKYLNGGPGSPAFLYVRKDLQEHLQSPIWGWFGQNKPFNFDIQYKAAAGIHRFYAGSPPMLSLSSLHPSLDIITKAGIERLRLKSISQTEYLISLFRHYLQSLGFGLGSPTDSAQRGSHVSLCHPEAFRICKALINPPYGEKTIIPDFREPDNIRMGIAPLYNRYTDIFEAVMRMKTIVETASYEDFDKNRSAVS